MNETNAYKPSPVKVLSLDGGGVRGYLTTMILENIEKQLNIADSSNRPLGSYFDLIAGTSTGSIIGSLLAIGTRASEIRALYESDMASIFSFTMKRNIFRRLWRAKYRKTHLEEKVRDYFKDMTFNDVKTHLLVTSVDITTMTARFHKSGYNTRYYPRTDELLANAVLASTAAPSFFPLEQKLKHSAYLIDGAIVANNPSLVALIDSFSFKNEVRDDIKLLSVGTGKMSQLPYELSSLKDASFGWINPMKGPPLIEIIMRSQSDLVEKHIDFLAHKLEGQISHKRINPILNFRLKLDEYENIDLLKNLSDINHEDLAWILNNLSGQHYPDNSI